MEIYLSVGVSALVALMASHRTGDRSDRMEEIAHSRPEPAADNAPTVECDLFWC
jgi:hypothetical protein